MMVVRTGQTRDSEPASIKIVLGASVPLDDAGTGREIARRVRAGEALLEAVSTPWGVEFYVREVVRDK